MRPTRHGLSRLRRTRQWKNGKVYVDPGMNWCKYICTDKDVLIGYLRRLRHIDVKDDDEILYNKTHGYYSINVHFDGRWI